MKAATNQVYLQMTVLAIFIALMQALNTVSAQRTVDALLLKSRSSDTLEVKIINKNNLFPMDSFNLMSLHKNVIVKGQEKETWIKTKDIDYISFVDFKGNFREFISIEAAPELKQIDSVNRKLYERMCIGRITWYREYSPCRLLYPAMACDHLLKEDTKPVSLRPTSNRKKKILKLTADMPELATKIKEMKSYGDMLEIIKAYNNNE